MALDLCSALQPRGVEVDLLSLDLAREFGVPLIPPARMAKTSLVPCRSSHRFRWIWAPRFQAALTERLCQCQAELIHDHGLWLTTNHAAAEVSRRKSVPRLVTLHGMLDPWSMAHKAWKKSVAWHLFQKRDLHAAQVLHATSEAEARDARSLGLRQPIVVIPNGVDLPLDATRKPRSSFDRTALFLGRIHPVKGLLNLIHAWAMVRPPNWKMIITGPDEIGHQAELEAAINAAGLSHCFSFTGPVTPESKWNCYRQADLFVLPSFTENFGVAAAEALGVGVPVITTRGTPWQALEKTRCGWWVDANPVAIADALRSATQMSDSERDEMGKRGRQLVLDQFTWLRAATEMHAVYEWMSAGGSEPASLFDE